MIFDIQLTDGRIVYMRCRDSQLQDHGGDYVVVWVDAVKFLNQWDKSQHCDCSLDDYANRTKLPWAEDGFSRGRDNPVPLSEVGMVVHPACGKIRLVNGITRIVWLIRNQALSFPVLCHAPEGPLLEMLCGKSKV